ncbi:MAG: beta-ketoacyl-[acyl-carrier-protein] synthase family protein [Verrucomicrobia bacterium]|nr:beta-ketoacyl-[acyl-carrier-protein] synthase family protein [Verrucomicrobiota bacterium]
MIKRNRVVITGMGVVAPNGIGLEAFWDSLLNCRSGIGPITLFDASNFKSRIAGEVKNFNPLDFIEPELKPKRMARHTQLAYAASMMALEDAGLDIAKNNLPSPTPVIIGVSMNAMDVVERAFDDTRRAGPNRAATTTSAASIPSAPASVIADRIGSCANAATVSSACPSGLDAIADAAWMIRSGEVDVAIAGGADAPITPLVMSSFIASGLVNSHNGDIEKASKPFDCFRKSGVLSEGAAVCVLESLHFARARAARWYAEVTGYGKRRDPDPNRLASGLIDSIRLAVANACHSLDDIDYICAYGPGDYVLDAAEASIVKDVFGERSKSVPISSIKGVTGNPLAAGGPLQFVASALTIRNRVIPPTANYEVPDPNLDLDFVPKTPRRSKVDCVLINVRGLGGSATSMVLDRG